MTPRAEAGERLRRLLAVLAWLARRGRAPVTELAERFGIGPAELIADLELAACCGLPPYTPDQLMEIVIDEDEVVARLGPELARPRRLSASEGFALATAARAIVDVPGADPDGALARALSKLEAVLGDRRRLVVDLDEPTHLEAIRTAADTGAQLEISYHSASRDDTTDRVVDPLAVFTRDGHWYLDAYCHHSDGLRRFRIDRIQAVCSTGMAACHGATQDGAAQDDAASCGHLDAEQRSAMSAQVGAPFVPGADVQVAVLAVDTQGEWITEVAPILGTETLADGRTAVSLGVVAPAWFERILLQLGPHGEVVSPPELIGVGVAAARRLLDLYGSSDSAKIAAGRRAGQVAGELLGEGSS